MANPSPSRNQWLPLARGAIKLIALLVGGALALLSLMALLGTFVDHLWLRGGLALACLIGVPLLIAGRLISEDDPRAARGLPSDVTAVLWMGIAVLVIGFGIAWTRPLIVDEAKRLDAAGWDAAADATWWLAGGEQRSSAQGGDNAS